VKRYTSAEAAHQPSALEWVNAREFDALQGELESMRRMFLAACEALDGCDQLLGLNEEPRIVGPGATLAAIQSLVTERDGLQRLADSRGEQRDALVAHMERMTEAACSEGAGPKMRAAIDDNPTHSLARRDAKKQAEGTDMVAKSAWSRKDLELYGATPQEIAANLATLIGNDLRRQAEGGVA
jgi:hypothetical protein